jgi:hypothetical protein
MVLEKHDLALSKARRGDDHDLQQLAELHRCDPLDVEILVTRFVGEMKYGAGDGVAARAYFLNTIDYVFGELERVAVERHVPLDWMKLSISASP